MTGKAAPVRKRPNPRRSKPLPSGFDMARLAWQPDLAGYIRLRASVVCDVISPTLERAGISLRQFSNSVLVYEREPGAVRAAKADRGLAGSFIRSIDREGYLSSSAAVREVVTERANRRFNEAIVKARDIPEADLLEDQATFDRTDLICRHRLLCKLTGEDPHSYQWNGVGFVPKRNQ